MLHVSQVCFFLQHLMSIIFFCTIHWKYISAPQFRKSKLKMFKCSGETAQSSFFSKKVKTIPSFYYILIVLIVHFLHGITNHMLLIHPLLRGAIQRHTKKPEERVHRDFVKFNRNKVFPQERSSRTQHRLRTGWVCREDGQYIFPPIYT